MKTNFSRRNVLQLAGAAAATNLVSVPFAMGQALPKLVMIAGFDHSIEQLPELNAIAGGHFAAHGLDVESMTVRGTSVAIQQVVTGSAHFVRCGAMDVMGLASAQDVPMVSAGIDLHGGIFFLVSLGSAPIRGPEDLRGKTIGLKSLAVGQENALNMILASAGIAPEEVAREVASADAGNVEFLKQGRLDGFMVSLEPTLLLRDSGEDLVILSVNDYAPIPGGAIVTNNDWASANPEQAKAFMAAMRASAQEIVSSDINVILDRVHGAFDLVGPEDRAFEIKIFEGYKELMLLNGEENLMRNVPEAWANAVAMANAAGIMQVADATALYTNAYDQ